MNGWPWLVAACGAGALLGCTDPHLPAPSGGGGMGGAGGSGAGGGSGGTGGAGLSLTFEPLAMDEPLDQVTDMAFVPGRDEILVLEKQGRVVHFAFDGETASYLGEFLLPVFVETDCGLISVAFAPDFPITQSVYLGYCADRQSSQISRFDLGLPYDEVLASEQLIIVLDEPAANEAWHNVGSFGFEPSGVLWALFGEKTIGSNAQDLASDLGKLIRIVPKAGEPGFDPAPDNPYAGEADKSPNVYASGLRSPWKGTRDAAGRIWFGDVGSNKFEEVNLIDAPGQNFGWNLHEGPCDERLGDDCRDPITHWDRTFEHPYPADDPDAIAAGTRVVWVGPHIEPMLGDPYQGKLDGLTFFGDFIVGWIRVLGVSTAGTITFDQHVGHLPHAGVWVRGPSGHVYALTYGPLKAMDPAALYVVRVD